MMALQWSMPFAFLLVYLCFLVYMFVHVSVFVCLCLNVRSCTRDDVEAVATNIVTKEMVVRLLPRRYFFKAVLANGQYQENYTPFLQYAWLQLIWIIA